MQELDHRHMVGTIFVSRPPLTAEEGESWLRELVVKIGMKILIEPKAVVCDTFGNEGVTGIVCLETSHASFHSWSSVDKPFINFDVYSCKHFDAQTVLDHFECFEPVRHQYAVIDRNQHVNVVESAADNTQLKLPI